MSTTVTAEAESLAQTATRLQRVGLIVDRRALSPAQRRAAFALQCRAVKRPDSEEATRPTMIGFAYPTTGTPARGRSPAPSQEVVPS
jgi:hypothetical protein